MRLRLMLRAWQLELALRLQSWKVYSEQNFDEDFAMWRFWRFAAVSFTIEGLFAIYVMRFLWTHGQG